MKLYRAVAVGMSFLVSAVVATDPDSAFTVIEKPSSDSKTDHSLPETSHPKISTPTSRAGWVLLGDLEDAEVPTLFLNTPSSVGACAAHAASSSPQKSPVARTPTQVNESGVKGWFSWGSSQKPSTSIPNASLEHIEKAFDITDSSLVGREEPSTKAPTAGSTSWSFLIEKLQTIKDPNEMQRTMPSRRTQSGLIGSVEQVATGYEDPIDSLAAAALSGVPIFQEKQPRYWPLLPASAIKKAIQAKLVDEADGMSEFALRTQETQKEQGADKLFHLARRKQKTLDNAIFVVQSENRAATRQRRARQLCQRQGITAPRPCQKGNGPSVKAHATREKQKHVRNDQRKLVLASDMPSYE